MIEAARRWVCDGCGTVLLQTGDNALPCLPVIPYGWSIVEKQRRLPPRTIGTGADKVKIGASREVIRKVYCPFCDGRYE